MKVGIPVICSILAIGIIFQNCTINRKGTLPHEKIALSAESSEKIALSADAELLDSTEFKNNGVPYIIERRYRLPSGKNLYAYYDTEGNNIAQGTDVTILGMPGYREFNFGEDRRGLVQFMKLFKLGQPGYFGGVVTPSLSDSAFRPSGVYRDEFILLLDLYDETWVLEHRKYYKGYRSEESAGTDTTKIICVDRYSDK